MNPSPVEIYISGMLFSLITGLAFFFIERRYPFRAIHHKKRIWSDIGSLAYVWVIFVAFAMLEQTYAVRIQQFEWVGNSILVAMPTWQKLIAFYLIYDFLSYWAHRAMHTSRLWLSHEWHHSPQDIWWLSGCRASIIHVALYRLAYFAFFFFMFDSVTAMAISVGAIILNSWMHLNLQWRPWMRYVEYVFVTPRFHHLHHANSERFHDKNFGSLLTVWDRLFGTMVDPDSVCPDEVQFGLAPNTQLRMPHAAIGM